MARAYNNSLSGLVLLFRVVGGVGWLDKLKIKLSQLSTLVEVEVDAELGNDFSLIYTLPLSTLPHPTPVKEG